jgi:hypothetical protein
MGNLKECKMIVEKMHESNIMNNMNNVMGEKK